MHAVPGGGPATLEVDGTPVGGSIDFAGVTEFAEAPGGSVRLELKGPDGKTLSRATEDLTGARQTIVATKPDGGISLRAYPDGEPRRGSARVRAIHAAPELGAVQVSVDGTELGGPVQPGDATDYETVEPGTYEVAASRSGGGGPPLASRSGAGLTAGTASTALILGSGGERTQIIVAEDAAMAPEGGPATGLGGLDGGTPWLLVLGAAALAGAAGGIAHRRRAT